MSENEKLVARIVELEKQNLDFEKRISELEKIISKENIAEKTNDNVSEKLEDSKRELFDRIEREIYEKDKDSNKDYEKFILETTDFSNPYFLLVAKRLNVSEDELKEYAEYKRKQVVRDDKKALFDRIEREIYEKDKDSNKDYEKFILETTDFSNPYFLFVAKRLNVSEDELKEYAKYKRSQVIKDDKEKAKDSVSDNNVSQEKENNVSKSNDVKNDIVLSDDENELSKRLDEINKMFMSGEIVSQELNNERNSIINKMKEIKNSKMESTDKYPKLDSVDMSKLFKIYSKAEADNVYLNLMAEKYGVSKSAFHDMFKANMLKDSKIVENPSKKPGKIPSLDQNYNVKNRSINDVSGVYPFEMSNDSENKKTDDSVEKTQVVDNDSKPLTNTEKTRELPLTVEKLSENGGLEPDTLVRRFVKKIANIPGIKFLVNMHHERKKSSEVVDNYLDNTQLNVGFKTESVEKEKSREEWQKRADEVKKAEKEAAENVAVNDEPEKTKINAR